MPGCNSILAYGRTGTTKTSQIRYLAEYVYEKTGKKTRMITSDTGSLWSPVEDLVDAGLIVPLLFPIDPEYNPQSTMRKLRKGMWPKADALKPSVKVNNGWRSQNEWTVWGEKESKEIGAYAVESLTSYGSGILRDLREKNIVIGGASVPGFRTEDEETFASNTMQHYGMGQGEILDMLQSFVALPIEMVYFTALEGAGEDDDGPSKRTVLGPKSVGKAITEVIPQRVGDCLHLVDFVDGDKREIRAYLRNHPDAQVARMNWPAKVRMLNTPKVLAEFNKKFPQGYMTLSIEKGIRELLEFKDAMKASMKKEEVTVK